MGQCIVKSCAVVIIIIKIIVVLFVRVGQAYALEYVRVCARVLVPC